MKACIHPQLPNAPWALPGSQVPPGKSFPRTLPLDSVARFQDEDRTEGTWERVSVLVRQRSQARKSARVCCVRPRPAPAQTAWEGRKWGRVTEARQRHPAGSRVAVPESAARGLTAGTHARMRS